MQEIGKMIQKIRTMMEMMLNMMTLTRRRRAAGGSRQAKEVLRTKEIRAPGRCANAPPEGLCWGSRDTEGKEAKR